MPIKNSNGTIEDRSRNLPACRAVSEPTVPLRTSTTCMVRVLYFVSFILTCIAQSFFFYFVAVKSTCIVQASVFVQRAEYRDKKLYLYSISIDVNSIPDIYLVTS